MKISGIIFFIILLISFRLGLTQDLESKLYQLIEKNKIEELRANLDQVKRKYPNFHITYYVDALIERDGEKAITKYKRFISNFPDSPYVVNAKYRIAQFYYASGIYSLANQIIDELIHSNPNFPYIDNVQYLKIQCLIALERANQAVSQIKYFTKNYSNSPLKNLVASDLEQLKSKDNDKLSSANSIKQKYVIQVGAFLDKNNAIRQMNIISKWGYSMEISTKTVNNNLFYLVWIGNFETEEQALNSGEVFKKKYGIPFRVVKKEVNND